MSCPVASRLPSGPLVLVLALVLAGCQATDPSAGRLRGSATVAAASEHGGSAVPDRQARGSLAAHEPVLMALAMIGTPYRFGGNTLGGFDCSGLVRYVYAQGLGVELPHGALLQSELGGRPLRAAQLRSGDLVFFETQPGRISHVGLHVGDGRFVHAPSAGGLVRIDRLADPYWAARFKFGKRL